MSQHLRHVVGGARFVRRRQHADGAKSRCMAAIISSVSARMLMPRSSARRMILSSMSVMLRT
jgi:hypothetical protein